MDVKEFIAHQLNDHHESPSGVDQSTYTEWSEGHITYAVYLATRYLLTLVPQVFNEVNEVTVDDGGCIVSFCDVADCETFVEILTININGSEFSCVSPDKTEKQTNDLSLLLDSNCMNDEDLTPSYHVIDALPCSVRFNKPVPKGASITYVCSNSPDAEDITDSSKYSKYMPLIADYALWWLYRTDTESRSNLDRARLHFEGLKDFVTNTLLMEFSLRDDGYNFGRRKVDGNDNTAQ